MQVVAMLAMLVFVAMMVAVGVVCAKQTQTLHGFLLGGRNVGAWMSAFAYGTSYFSAVIFIGYAGKTGWGIGLGGVWIGVFNALLGSLLAWLVLARRTRRMTHALNASTMPEFFAARYHCEGLKIVSALIIFIFLMPYAASVYMGLGFLFNAIFPGIPYVYCMFFIAALTSVYLVLGGYVATALSDFVQGIIMIFGIIMMVVMVVNNPVVGGISAGLHKLSLLENGQNLTHPFGGSNWPSLLSLILLTSFGTWGLPQMVHKFYAIRDEASISKATVISTLFAALIGTGAYFTGIFGRLFLNNTLPKEGFDKIVPDMLVAALSGGMFANVVFSVILLLVLSASMSTLSSVVLSASSALVVDLLAVVRPSITQKSQMTLLRMVCVIFIALSFVFASMRVTFIISLMSFSWGTVSGCFIGPYLWGLYSKKVTRVGAWTGMLAGFSTMILLVGYTTATQGFGAATANSPTFGACAMAASVIIVPIASALSKPFEKAHIENLFQKAYTDVNSSVIID